MLNATKKIRFLFNDSTFLLMNDDKIIAQCNYFLIKEDSDLVNLLYTHLKQTSLYITNFSTDKNHRRKGYAEILMKKIIKYSREKLKVNYLSLSVIEENKPALSLYNKLKFNIINDLKTNKQTFKITSINEIEDNSKYALLMTKKIK
jgi:ribosomal protein S18 acetylase RimI-like enzyme